jgi:dTDP-4-dehydrorhamnose reductase
MATLIIGATGLLGRVVHRHLTPHGALGTCHARTRPGLLPLDVRDPHAVHALLCHIRPDVVINAAGERRPAVWDCDPDATRALNVDAAAEIARAATETGAWLIHISTDYVFDGTAPPYTPDDPPHAVNDYGRDKLAAEHAVRDAAPTATILRVPVLYGPVQTPQESLVTEIAHALAQRRVLTLDHTTRRYPTHLDDVAAICTALINQPERPTGIWHFSSAEGHTKYEIAHLIATAHALPTAGISPNHTPPANRPGDCRLDSTALWNLLGEQTRAEIGSVGSFAERAATVTRPWIIQRPLYAGRPNRARHGRGADRS